MTRPLIARLRLVPLLTAHELAMIEGLCGSTRTVPAGADIAPQGDRPRSLHVVVDGWAARYKSLPNGRQHFPALFLPGDVCDLDGLLLHTVHSGVRALSPCTVAVLPHAQLRDLIDQRPAIRDAFWWMGCVENAIATEWSFGLGRRTAGERLGHLLCELLARLRMAGLSTDDGYALPLSQVEVSDVLGLSAVHVNRVFKELREIGVLTVKNRWLTIHDHRALKGLSHFDPDYLHLEGPRARAGADRRGAADPALDVEPLFMPR
ncbi:Crp/Fnr family transcriptional regulator [Lichenibacterium dinghuense]|uniref:Crp/Fnr family transcriptional regulator n=1 Tax=Lichenibacterium dinghuense TaxID=2895977 RepID=UPI001F3CBF88|nr:Crp/Fnr family transcriptional regulator [Lichenibacterium sp. 6Y81]